MENLIVVGFGCGDFRRLKTHPVLTKPCNVRYCSR